MQKLFKRISKRIGRLFENVKKGSVVDIAILATALALAVAIVIVLVIVFFGSDGMLSSQSGDSFMQNTSLTSSSAVSGTGGVNPFGDGDLSGASSSSSDTSQQDSQSLGQEIGTGNNQTAPPPYVAPSASTSVSTSQSGATSGSVSFGGESEASSSSSVSQSASQSSSASSSVSQSTPPPAGHEHTYTAWTRNVEVCEAGYEIRTCTTCEPGTIGHEERRAVLAVQGHTWGEQTPVYEQGSANPVGYSMTCQLCSAQWTEYYVDSSSSSEETPQDSSESNVE